MKSSFQKQKLCSSSSTKLQVGILKFGVFTPPNHHLTHQSRLKKKRLGTRLTQNLNNHPSTYPPKKITSCPKNLRKKISLPACSYKGRSSNQSSRFLDHTKELGEIRASQGAKTLGEYGTPTSCPHQVSPDACEIYITIQTPNEVVLAFPGLLKMCQVADPQNSTKVFW